MPVFNGERYLHESISTIISQTYHPVEAIIVDDGSTDGSSDIIKSFPQVQYIYQDNGGQASARNRGIRAAKGQYLAFLDADDLWVPEKLTLQMAAFIAEPDLEIVTGHVTQFVSPELRRGNQVSTGMSSKPLVGYSSTAILIKRGLLKKVGLFHERCQVMETISWFAKVMESKHKTKILPDVLVKRRIHENNHSIRHRQGKNKAIIKLLKDSLDRRRAENSCLYPLSES